MCNVPYGSLYWCKYLWGGIAAAAVGLSRCAFWLGRWMWFLSWNSWHLLRYRLKNGSGIPTRSCSTGEMCVRKNTHIPAAMYVHSSRAPQYSIRTACNESRGVSTYILCSRSSKSRDFRLVKLKFHHRGSVCGLYGITSDDATEVLF